MDEKSNNIANTIASILNIEPISSATFILKEEKEKTKFESANGALEVETSNEIMKDSIDTSVDMLSEIARIAKDTQNARFFEAFTELFKSVITANKEFLEAKNIAKNLHPNSTPLQTIDGDSPRTTVNQIVMTTADFAKLLTKHKESNRDDGG